MNLIGVMKKITSENQFLSRQIQNQEFFTLKKPADQGSEAKQ
jgi:hypothetical protein